LSLRQQFAPDLARIFINTNEHATEREFRVSDGRGGTKTFVAPVVWDEEAAKQMPTVRLQGIYMGDVQCYIEQKYLPRKPVPQEIIYSPANTMWEVVDCTDEEGCWLLYLSATRSQPGSYTPA